MAEVKKIVKGTKVRQVMEIPFEGVISEFRVDGENGDVLYKVSKQVMNEDGTPKMTEDIHGDAEIEVDDKGGAVLDPETGRPKETGKMVNVRKSMIAVYEEKFFTREQLQVVED